jgi:hypothetical protein
MIRVVSGTMPNAPWIGKPENQRCLAAAVSDIVLKISNCRVNGLLQPLDYLLRVECVHRGFQASDDERPVIDKIKRVFGPSSLVQA